MNYLFTKVAIMLILGLIGIHTILEIHHVISEIIKMRRDDSGKDDSEKHDYKRHDHNRRVK